MKELLLYLNEKNVKLNQLLYTRINGLSMVQIKISDIGTMTLEEFLEFKSKFFICSDAKSKTLKIFL